VRALLQLGLPRPTEAGTGAAAMAQAAELEPALVLCDALLEGPDGMDGLELLFRIRADSTTLPQRIPVVLLAGEAGSPGVMEAKRLGVDGFLVKPVPAKRLQTRLNAVLMRRFPERVIWGT
ncbi:MAG TPA: response regulator, partial [Thalassobaculum sp.]